jgi:hypothetical protein
VVVDVGTGASKGYGFVSFYNKIVSSAVSLKRFFIFCLLTSS